MAGAKLQALAKFWQEMDLTAMQARLDDEATAITQRQDASEESRKALIEQMREFKRANNEEVRSAVATLVKSFQAEVDGLGNRAIAAEKAYFDVYKKILDFSDPAPLLQQAVETQKSVSRIHDMDIEIKQLKQIISDYNVEIQEYKIKEKTLTALQTKVDAYDRNIDATLEAKLQNVREHMLEEYNDKLRIIAEEKDQLVRRNVEMDSKLLASQRQISELKTELFEAVNKTEEKKNARSEEIDMLVNDLEVSQQRVASAEREAEALREKLALLMEQRESSPSKDAEDDLAQQNAIASRELGAKERELHQLMSDMHKLQGEKQSLEQELGAKVGALQKEKETALETVKKLESKLATFADYESIKKDLDILKSHEFPNEDDHAAASKKPLEVMIMERSKVLQAENTSLRMEKEKATEELALIKRESLLKAQELDRHQKLVVELESHVEHLQELNSRGEAEGRSSADILDSLVLATMPSTSTPPLYPASESIEGRSAESSSSSSKALLPIVQAQRERFRQRNAELEVEQEQNVKQLTLLQAQVKDLTTDNVKLYEKIRFLQGYQAGRFKNDDGGNDTSVNVEAKYRNRYEERLDPFASFSQQERQRRYGQLNVAEKILLSFVQFMVSNKIARLFIFFYSVLLHLLVFTVLMKMAYNDASRRDQAFEAKFVQHMNEVHGHT